eukprot:1155523-Pelagomonas_calceolata.AAC.4
MVRIGTSCHPHTLIHLTLLVLTRRPINLQNWQKSTMLALSSVPSISMKTSSSFGQDMEPGAATYPPDPTTFLALKAKESPFF